MNVLDKKVLKEKRIALIQDLKVEDILEQLVSVNILSNAMSDDIRTIQAKREQNIRFLNLLEKRGPKAFGEFITSLKLSAQYKLLELLTGKKYEVTPLAKSQLEVVKTLKRQLQHSGENNFHLVKRANLDVSSFEIKKLHPLPTNAIKDDDEDSEFELDVKDVIDGPTEDELHIQVCSPQFMFAKERGSYKMRANPRGLALLISIEDFEPYSGLADRKGSHVDVERLEVVLKQLRFVCHRLINGTYRDIWNTLKGFASLADLEQSDCMLIAVMSHGVEGSFYGRDGQPINIEQMLTLFNNQNCPQLQNKPKIFLIQACRGRDPDMGIDEMDGDDDYTQIKSLHQIHTRYTINDSPNSGFQQQHGDDDALRMATAATPLRNKLPINSDYFIGYGTVSGYAAMRNTYKGSWFIQAFVRVLARHAHDRHFLEIMTDVNRLVMKREGRNPRSQHHRCKAMSESRNTLSKLLYFFPGL